MRFAAFALTGLVVTALAGPVVAQDRRASHCIAIAEADPELSYVHQAAYGDPLPDDYTVRLHYIDHSMFVIETAGGLQAVTDYNGFLGADVVPDVVTMNYAHSSHWTTRPDPRIPHVLEGWEPGHRVDLGEMFVRNVTTDIRSSYSGAEPDGNSIFVFEVGGLCIGHLGHLHHEPDDGQYAALGRLDVVMAPVDGGLTLDLESMIDVLQRLESSVVLPMHWFGQASLERFLDGISGSFDVDVREESSIEVSLRNLPDRPSVVVLQPQFLTDE